jgi:hypothetical protein
MMNMPTDDDGGHFYTAGECATVGGKLRAAFGIEEATK